MENNGKKPVLILASAMTVFITAGFLLVVNIGTSERKTQGIHYDLNSRGAETAAPTYFSDFERGARIIKNRSDRFMAGFFGGPAAVKPASGQAETARRNSPREEDEASYSYQRKSEEDDYPESGSDAGNSFWSGLGGREPAGSGSLGASFYSAGRQSAAGKNQLGSVGSVPPGRKGRDGVPRGVFGGAATREERAAAPKLYASLPGNNAPQKAGLNPGGLPEDGNASGGHGGRQLPKGGSVSNMPGQRAGANLDGASESMKSASQSDYNSKMSGGAGAAAPGTASSGGGVPAVSAPRQVSAGGNAEGSSAETGDAAEKTASDAGTGAEEWTYDATENHPDLLKTVLAEKLNGTDTKYVSELEAADSPDEKLLKADGTAGNLNNKDFSIPEPEDLNSLSEERKAELKKELHVFMAKVENKYGKMTDLYRTACALTPDVCKARGMTGSYLTMTTEKGATLVFGLKHVNGKWRLYTMDFKTRK